MRLVEKEVNEYLDILSSDAPAPGGGSASALAGAQGAALLVMVCKLTLGKERFSEYQEICEAAMQKAQKLTEALIKSIDEDTDAFILVSNAYKLPKTSEDEKKARSAAIQAAHVKATEIPLEVMESACEGLRIISGLEGQTNPAAMSDLGVAALNFITSVRGAWLNVKINLPGIKSAEQAEGYMETGRRISEAAERIDGELQWLRL